MTTFIESPDIDTLHEDLPPSDLPAADSADGTGNPLEDVAEATTRPEHGQSAGQLLWLDPAKLERARNRPQKPMDPEIAESIKRIGNVVPIVVVQTGEDLYEVHDGWHRTVILRDETDRLARCAVFPVDTSLDEIEAAAARIEMQFASGAHRYDQDAADRLDAIAQMLELDIDPTAIRERLVGTTHKEVKAVAKAKKSASATQAVFDGQLDIIQAGLIGEHFGDDAGAETIEALVDAAAHGQFEHTLQQLIDERNAREAEARTAAAFDAWTAPFTAADITVLDDAPLPHEGFVALEDLVDGDGNTPTRDTVAAEYLAMYPVRLAVINGSDERITIDRIDPRSYQYPDDDPDPGMYHYAKVTIVDEWEPRYLCLDPEAAGLALPELEVDESDVSHGATEDGDHEDPEDRAARFELARQQAAEKAREEQETRAREAAARQNVTMLNRRARTATVVRRKWVIENLFSKKTVPPGAWELIGSVVSSPDLLNAYHAQLLRNTLGAKVSTTPSSTGVKARDNHGALQTLVAVCGALEAHLQPTDDRPDYYRRATGHMRRYFEFLRSCGYVSAPIERVPTGEFTTAQVLGEEPIATTEEDSSEDDVHTADADSESEMDERSNSDGDDNRDPA